ncbi:MAG: DegV family protein [Clostridia bacterium]|nr:DegV family protein [Clostridia bacterium]
MAQNYIFMTDSDSDLYYEIADQRNIPVVQMPYAVNGVEYMDDNGRNNDPHAFFEAMRKGAVPVTSKLPTEAYLEYFEPILQKSDLLFIAFSSKMSATIESVREAQATLLKKYPERKFIVCDTMLISAPMSLLVIRAHDMYLAGKSMEEIAQWVEDNKFRFHAWMTVDDLVYLKRGGRISPTSAFFGSVLSIKPVLNVGRNGLINAIDKVQGRKNALRTIVDHTAEDIEQPESQELLIMQGDVPEEAERVKEMLLQKIPTIKSVRIQPIGPVIGAHCGPGTIAIAFYGKEKQ